MQPFTAFNTKNFNTQPAQTYKSKINYNPATRVQQAQNTISIRSGAVDVEKYANEALNSPLTTDSRVKATNEAMIAYITESIKNGDWKADPVCAAATLAYFDAYIEDKSEAAANEAAAVAYLETLDKTPDSDPNSACAKAAEAYIAQFN